MFHLGVGRSQIEWKLKVKTQISVFPWAKIGQNDHSNPYIESTTVLCDYTLSNLHIVFVVLTYVFIMLRALHSYNKVVHAHNYARLNRMEVADRTIE